MKRGEKIFFCLAFVLAFFNSAFIGEIRQIRAIQRQLRKDRAATVATASTKTTRELRYDGVNGKKKNNNKAPLKQYKTKEQEVSTKNNLVSNGDLKNNSEATEPQSAPASSEKDDRPLFVLHIGPPKTGTTTIQWAGRQYPGLLKKDNFYFLGNQQNVPEKLLHEMVRNCRDWIEPACEDKWKEFSGIVKSHLKKKHNVFMSEEMLNVCAKAKTENYSLWERLEPVLEGWNVRILYTYRRLAEWVPSKYHQAFSFDVPDHRKHFRDNWPVDGGRIISSFSEFFDNLMIKRSFQLPLAVKKRWRQHFPDSEIRVFNMHAIRRGSQDRSNSDTFLREFFCQEMPEAERLCQYLTSKDSKEETYLNPSTDKAHHFDMLAVGAYQGGLIDKSKNMTRRHVSDAAESHARIIGFTKTNNFPLECISPEQATMLLDQTLEYEKEMVSEEYYNSPNGEDEIRKQFEAAMDNGKYCSVHVEKTLKHPKWKEFFTSL